MLKAPPVDEQQLQFQAFLGTAPGTAPQLTGLPPSLRALLPSAHAYDISFWDVASIIGSLVGLDSIQVIWDQMANLATGRSLILWCSRSLYWMYLPSSRPPQP